PAQTPPMTSSPTNSMPRSRMTGPMREASQRSRSVNARLSAVAPAARLPRWSPAAGLRTTPCGTGPPRTGGGRGAPAGGDLGRVALRNRIAAAVVGQRLDYDARIPVALRDYEDR